MTVDKSADVEITVSPATFTIPAGGTQVITVEVNPSFSSEGAWQFGRIQFETDAEFESGKEVSNTAMSLAVKADVSGSTLPGALTETIDQPEGSYTFEDQRSAVDITNMSDARFGLTPATVVTIDVPQDNTPANVYDNQHEVGVIISMFVEGQPAFGCSGFGNPSLDIDIYMGNGCNPIQPSRKLTR